MREYRVTLFLIIVLGLLAGTYYFIQNRESGDDLTDTADQSLVISRFDLDAAVGLTIENSSGTHAFEKKDGEWVLASPDGLDFNKEKISNILYTLADLDGERVFDVDPDMESLSSYGLDKPGRYTVKLADGSTKDIELGARTPTRDGYYVRLKDGEKVYTILAYKGEALYADKENLEAVPAQ